MNGTLLIVDDEEDVLLVVTEYLAAQGYRVVSAASGRAAVETLNTTADRFDVAIVDWSLPDVAGDDLVRHVRERQPDCAILVTTGHSDQVLSDEVLAEAVFGALAAGFVRKPFTMRALASRVATLLQERAMHEACHDF